MIISNCSFPPQHLKPNLDNHNSHHLQQKAPPTPEDLSKSPLDDILSHINQHQHRSEQMHNKTTKDSTQEQTEQATKNVANHTFKGCKTVAYLMKLPRWKKLPKREQRLLKIFYPNRWCRASYKELGKKLGVSRGRAQEIMQELEGLMNKNNNFCYHRKTGDDLKKYLENYYCLNVIGRAYIDALIDFLFDGYISLAKKEKTDRKTQKVFTTHTSKHLSKLKKNKPRQQLQLAGRLSLEKRRSFGLSVYLKQSRSKKAWKRRKFELLFSPNSKKAKLIKALFEAFGFENHLKTLNKHNFMKLLSYSVDSILKLLRLIDRKLFFDWDLRSFWGFFFHEMKKVHRPHRFARPWFPMLSGEYRDAMDGKETRLKNGIDTSINVEQMQKMENMTKERISERKLERMVRYGTERMKSALNAVGYRMSLGKGGLPDDKKEEDEAQEKGRPIYAMVKVNVKTKKPYTEEDRLAGAPFTLMQKIVGYEPLKTSQKAKKKAKPKQKYTEIKSWIAMTFFALKKGSPEAIRKAFFERKEKFHQTETETFEGGWANFDWAS